MGVACNVHENRNVYKILLENLDRNYQEDLNVNKRVTLTWILQTPVGE
jgi:hypothetical protein